MAGSLSSIIPVIKVNANIPIDGLVWAGAYGGGYLK